MNLSTRQLINLLTRQLIYSNFCLLFSIFFNIMTTLFLQAVSTCKCTARKVKEYFRKNTQAGYENLIFLSGDGLFCQQLC